jgi:hypothetical protein
MTCGEQEYRRIQTALGVLRWHWDGAYQFGWDGAKSFAVRADTRELVTAPTPEGLAVAVRCDYRKRPVPRDLPQD